MSWVHCLGEQILDSQSQPKAKNSNSIGFKESLGPSSFWVQGAPESLRVSTWFARHDKNEGRAHVIQRLQASATCFEFTRHSTWRQFLAALNSVVIVEVAQVSKLKA